MQGYQVDTVFLKRELRRTYTKYLPLNTWGASDYNFHSLAEGWGGQLAMLYI